VSGTNNIGVHEDEAILARIGSETRNIIVEFGREIDTLPTRSMERSAYTPEVEVGANEAGHIFVKENNEQNTAGLTQFPVHLSSGC
jgi:hypothetical protein